MNAGERRDQLEAEIARQDTRYGTTFGGQTALGRIRLGVACLEDEVEETRNAWREDRRKDRYARTREEALQVAALAMRLVRQIDVEHAAKAGT